MMWFVSKLSILLITFVLRLLRISCVSIFMFLVFYGVPLRVTIAA